KPPERQLRSRTGVHAGGLEHRRKAVAPGKPQRSVVGLWHVEIDAAALRVGGELPKQRVCRRLVIGIERSEFEAFPTGPDRAQPHDSATLERGQRSPLAWGEPQTEKRRARRRKEQAVIGKQPVERNVGHGTYCICRRRFRDRRCRSAEADIAISEPEAG